MKNLKIIYVVKIIIIRIGETIDMQNTRILDIIKIKDT